MSIPAQPYGRQQSPATSQVNVGRQKRRSVTGKTQAKVLTRLREAQNLQSDGIEIPSATLTVGTMLERWITYIVPGTVATLTEQQYRHIVTKMLIPRIGRKHLKTLAPFDVTMMLRDLALPRPDRAGYSANSQRLARSVLRRALRWAETEGLVTRNVAALANPVKVARPDNRSLTPDEAKVFLEQIKGDRLEALYIVGLTTGLRISELLGLAWDDVRLDPPGGTSPTLSVRQALKNTDDGMVLEDVKNKSSRRTIHLPATTVTHLRGHRQRQISERGKFGGDWPEQPLGTDLVFRTRFGTPLDRTNIGHSFSKHTKAAGLGHWHPHELRHSAASLLLAQGVPLKVVSNLLGDSGIAITADIYSHVLAPLNDEAAAAMDRVIGG